ncbi:terminase small subunit [Acetobacter pomorum]|uniref:terminase small subunit n=1 Tax=Acetobacter pomorum TaxID=65959 RepID=UPI0022A8D770|nr:terminase small subunit [Acetobacter pomorum]
MRAGYSEKTSRSIAQRLLTNVDIQNAISEAQKARSKRTQITQDRVLQEFAKIGFSDIRKRSGFCNQSAREAATFVILHRPRKVSLRWSF